MDVDAAAGDGWTAGAQPMDDAEGPSASTVRLCLSRQPRSLTLCNNSHSAAAAEPYVRW